ncbi:MAG: DUF58 domain-containing protein [Candidatus Tokpelaia sp.]|uniref:DUF58 domain-containing protein n=1 Tax=Candidatus Tokpelaia sp. TaxID=2233777 RepID=UPI00123A5AAD|nr:DUF58 domain-containing protein [Candidatus Tokpelaia sp.]KAA6205067.1 MAG: DUF58 domain-containing protein [Candidatus Tokpelaia sp.]KAA6206531.1 MAG: DUF58 domain-containing protein [Candidatus Tokpelaia sp.]KAA6405829.1 DUF58 domain-containing protein [Candidatus Tokpelaia sp.]
MTMGANSRRPVLPSLLAEAGAQAARLEQVLWRARRLAETVAQGQRRQRKRGQGENFRQFRLYQAGEASSSIDWRRSSRDDEFYIRDKEHEIAQTVYLMPDLSASMHYCSRQALCSKEERALLWLFMLAEFFVKSGERVAVPGLLPPGLGRNAAEKLAAALLEYKSYPQTSGIKADFAAVGSKAHCIIISDFLDKVEDWERIFALLAEKGAHIGLIIIADPAETDFPFSGDTVFCDPESGEEVYFGQVQTMAAAYREIYQQQRQSLARQAAAFGGTLLEDETNAPLQNRIEKLERFLQRD